MMTGLHGLCLKWKHLRKGSFILLVMDAFYDEDVKFAADNGLLTLCTEGCGMDSVLVVNSEDPATYGTVWYLDLANEVGIIPMYDPKTKKPFHFLDWLEYWVEF